MDKMENERLVDAINFKYPHNNIIELYYNIGRALPFTAQRFPGGRDSDWYRSQYVEVVDVKPGGKHGKYGKAYGFYYRNGKREDSSDDGCCWCRKDDTVPQEIPLAGCGDWVLMEIGGEPTVEPVKVLGPDDMLDFGKYKGKKFGDVIIEDWQYVKWAVNCSENLFVDTEEIVAYHEENMRKLSPTDKMTFGKYSGRTIREIFDEDIQYLQWLENNNSSFRVDWKQLRDK